MSVAVNFAFGSSFGRTGFEGYAYGAAFGFADVLKVAAPLVITRSLGNRNWATTVVSVLVWGTFTLSSVVSAIGFASANRTFVVNFRTVQAALNQSRLASLDADQHELRRLRDRLASAEVGRSERVQLAAAALRLEATLGATRGKLEDAAPIVTMPNPQAHTLAKLTGVGADKIEVGLVLLVALLVEVGGLGPLITMNLAKVPRPVKVPGATSPKQSTVGQPATVGRIFGPQANDPLHPKRIHRVATPENLEDDLGRFLDRHARQEKRSDVGSSDLLARYNDFRREHGVDEVSQRRLGDAMGALGYRNKLRHSGGRIHYQGLEWVDAGMGLRTVGTAGSRPGIARARDKRWVEPHCHS